MGAIKGQIKEKTKNTHTHKKNNNNNKNITMIGLSIKYAACRLISKYPILS